MFGWFGVEPASEAPAPATQGRPTGAPPIPEPAAGHSSGGRYQVGVWPAGVCERIPLSPVGLHAPLGPL
jgi:hypothetical protein